MNKEALRDGLVERSCASLLSSLSIAYKLPVMDDNFKDTPARMARAYHELLEGSDAESVENGVEDLLQATFPCQSDEMVVVSGIRVIGLCPHHMLPVDYVVAAAYVPSRDGGRVLGLSKIPRIVQLHAKLPRLQEQLVGDIADTLMRIPGCKGSACYAAGVHHCMSMRGVKERNAVTTVSAVRGVFGSNQAARAEFLDLARKA